MLNRVRFGDFELDLQSGELSASATGDHPGTRVVLSQQPLRLLLMLIERKGAMVSREEIQKHFWPNDTIVEFDHSINVAIGKLRKTLRDSAENPQYIATIARRGYRLIVPVTRMAAAEDSRQRAAAGGAHPEPQAAAVLTGQTISHYRVLDIIGGGGMGLVYRAEDLKLGRRVAIKFLPDETATHTPTLQRFEREAQTASSLNHPNICTVYEFGEHKGQPFLVMELLQGKTLRDRLAAADGSGLPLEEILEIALQVSRGLQAAHDRGIIHRDIKPANIYLAGHDVCKILDFGLAKMLDRFEPDTATYPVPVDHELQPTSPAEGKLSRVGLVMGTASYMSPEQARAKKLDPRTDLFSFGAVLYEMATGRVPFPGDSASAVFDAILNKTPVSPVRLNPGLPPALERIINRALEKDRELRYQSAAEMRSELQRLKRDSESGGVIAAVPGAGFAAPEDGPEESVSPAATRIASHSSGSEPSLAPSETSRHGKLWKVLATATILVAAVVTVSFYFRPRSTMTGLGEQDGIVLADFTNTTGDSIFDGTLRQGLAAQLDQSPFLNLLSDRRVAQTLALMTQPKDARLTHELAREVCQRTASAATIEGSISTLGSDYVIGLKAVNCRNGDVLADEQNTASSKEQVLKKLGEAAARIRAKLGESLASVEKYDAPPENVTTASLEALNAYSLGFHANVIRGDYPAAILLFQRAIELDSNFAMAYAFLGANYNNLGQTALASENMRKAYELRERVGEREKFYIASRYAQMVTGNIEEMQRTCELWAQTYPRDGYPHGLLQGVYREWGEYDKALAEIQQEVKSSPESAVLYSNLALAYIQLDRLDEARVTVQEAQARNLDAPVLQYLYQIDFLQHNAAAVDRDAAALGKSHPDQMLNVEAETFAYAGQFAKARDMNGRAFEFALRNDQKETAAGYVAQVALYEALAGNTAKARQQVYAALQLSSAKDVEALSAIALGLSGNAARATQLSGDLASRFPEDTHVRLFYRPMIDATAALERRNGAKALEALAPSSSYELGSIWWIPLYTVYLRGESYLATREGAAAAAEFQKILDHPGIVVNDPIGALAHLGVARGEALAGDNAKAKAAYQDFLALWKDADPDVPVLKQAKAEYAKLR